LFTLYGVNIESVMVVVTGFLLGPGLGSLVGGYLSRVSNMPLLALFGADELSTAVYGFFSLRLFHEVVRVYANTINEKASWNYPVSSSAACSQ
jgi:spermidine synthase